MGKSWQDEKVVVITAGNPSQIGPIYIDLRESKGWWAFAEWDNTVAGTWRIRSGGLFDGPSNATAKPGIWLTATPVDITHPAGTPDNAEMGGAAPNWTSPWVEITLMGITGSGTARIGFGSKE